TVRENVGYRLYEAGEMTEDEIEVIVRRQLGFVGLEEAIDKMPAELSGGMKRRVGIARALVGSPDLVLYDEPTAGLDPITKRSLLELVIALRDLEGVTSVFVTHDLRAAEIVATEYLQKDPTGRVVRCRDASGARLVNINFIMIREGEIVFQGGLPALRANPDPEIQKFLA